MVNIYYVICLLICIWAYVCTTLAFRQLPVKKLSSHIFKNKQLQRQFNDIGMTTSVKRYQAIRYGIMLGFLLSPWIASGFAFVAPMVISPMIWLLSGPSGLRFIMKVKKKLMLYETKRDGELIAFARLYELQQRTKKVQLPTFCRHSAEFLPLLSGDLILFAQQLTTEGSKAFKWFENRFPPNHLFLHKLLNAIQSIENGAEDHSLGHFIEKVSQDHYLKRKKAIAPILNTLMSLPSALVIFMIVVLLMQYISITTNNISLF